jgi:hypothetical protein
MMVVVVNSRKWGHNLLLEQLPHHLAGYRFSRLYCSSAFLTANVLPIDQSIAQHSGSCGSGFFFLSLFWPLLESTVSRRQQNRFYWTVQ